MTYSKKDLPGDILAIIILLSILIGLFHAIHLWVRYDSRTDCAKLSEATTLETEYVVYGYWDAECMIVLPDGTSIPKNQYYIVGND